MIRLSTGAVDQMLSTGSFASVFQNGVMCIFSGTQPASADDAESGTLLAEINIDGGVFTPGGGVGLNFGVAADKSISKADAEVWRGTFLEDNTMGWFRFYDNSKTTGESTTAVRFDGSIGTSRTDIILRSTVTTEGGSITLDGYTLNFKQQL